MTEDKTRLIEIDHLPPLGQINQAHVSLLCTYVLKSAKRDNNFEPSIFKSDKFIYKRGDYEKINLFLSEINWLSLFSNKNVEKSY